MGLNAPKGFHLSLKLIDFGNHRSVKITGMHLTKISPARSNPVAFTLLTSLELICDLVTLIEPRTLVSCRISTQLLQEEKVSLLTEAGLTISLLVIKRLHSGGMSHLSTMACLVVQ